MRNKTRKLLSTLLTLTMLVSLITVVPMTASAATGPVTIDISTLGGTDVDNTANAAESQWAYDDTAKVLTLKDQGGDYTLTGTKAGLAVVVDDTVTGANVVLDGVNITAPAGEYAFSTEMQISSVWRVTFTGTCTLTGGTGQAAIHDGDGSMRLFIDDGASLTMTNNSAADESHYFAKNGTAYTHMWEYTNLEGFVLPQQNNLVVPTLLAGTNGTISRVEIGTANAPVTIDVSSLTAPQDNSSAVGTDSQWMYLEQTLGGNTYYYLILYTPGGEYELSGTRATPLRIYVASSAVGSNITLDGMTLPTSSYFIVDPDCETTVTLSGTNSITATGDAFQLGNDSSCIINGAGTLNATNTGSGYSGIILNINSDLSIEETATVNAYGNGTTSAGVYSQGSSLSVGSGATLNAEAASSGAGLHVWGASTPLTLNCDGTATFKNTGTGTARYGISFDGTLTLGGTGTVTAEGGSDSRAISAGSAAQKIVMDDNITLNITNNSTTTDETHTFEKSSASSALPWKLTGDATTADLLTDASIDVTVAAGLSGTIARAEHDDDVINISKLGGSDVTVGTYTNWSFDDSTNTITLTGDATVISTTPVTSAINNGILIIDTGAAGYDVTWTADYSCALPAGQTTLNVLGAGNFIMADGSLEQTNNNSIIYIPNGYSAQIYVSGGTITATGGWHAIYVPTDVHISGGTVSSSAAATEAAIATRGSGSVEVSGGTVSNASTGSAISIEGTGSVTVSGGTVQNTGGGGAINTSDGNITVSEGTVSASAANTINANMGNVTVSGGTVQNTGTGRAIRAMGASNNVSISGTAQVSAVSGTAIYADGASSTVNISGGTVEATGTGTAINAANIVTLAGGTVTANTGTAIEAPEIRVTGTATVENSASATNPAIKVGGLYTWNAAGNLTVNGNVVTEDASESGISANIDGTQITINGDVTLTGPFAVWVSASAYGSVLTIKGNLIFTSSFWPLITSGFEGKVYIAGTITGDPELRVGSKTLTIGSPTSLTTLAYPYEGYYWDEYTDDTVAPQSYVYIRQGAAPIPVILTAAGPLADGTVGTAYSVTLTATNGPTTSWTVTSGALPAGLTISGAGVISGRPTAAGMSTFSVTAANSIGSSAPVAYSITINAAPPAPPSGGGGGGGAAPTYTVTFVTNGGSAVASGKVAANGKLTKPADPTREGYDFAGWYTNAGLTTPYDFNSNVTEGFTLYAKWTEKGPTPVTPEMPVNPFTDVKGTDWFIDDVIYAYDKGLIDGTSPTTFSPNSNLTYAQAVTLAARMHQLYTKGEITLENGDDPWYQPYVDYAIENGIISGDYDWGAMATRAGYMQIFANALPDDAYAQINDVPDGSVPDVPMDYPGAAAIYKLYRAGILQGNDATHKCSPDNNIRRSEVAAILTRMMNPDARISFSM